MQIKHFYLLLLSFFLFLALLIVEYFLCGIYFRLVRPSDFPLLNGLCVFAGPLICYLLFRKPIQSALQERVPRALVAGLYIFFSFLLGFFLRFSVQLANGALDPSAPENHSVVVADRAISALGGSIREGINPMAHLVYFRDWELSDKNCVMLADQDFYYSVDVGMRVQVTVRRGLFRMPWVQDYQLINPRR